jgi:methylthioribulose-1-phosphate dehydratase
VAGANIAQLPMSSRSDLALRLAVAGRALHARGWALATSGNFSAVVTREPLVLTISRSGVDKGRLSAEDFLEVDDRGLPLEGDGRPSDETVVHLAVVKAGGAGAVLHTHSVWGTLVSRAAGDASGLALTGYEMLKGLAGVATHEHREWVPIVENTQDYGRMARDVAEALAGNPGAHGLLLRGHGLYAWGGDIEEATRHVEVLEFLFEVEGRALAATGRLKAGAAGEAAGGRDGSGQGARPGPPARRA